MKNELAASPHQDRIHGTFDTFASEIARHFDGEFYSDSSNQIHSDSLETGKVHTSPFLD